MKQMRHVPPLCWFVLFWFGGILVCWNTWSWEFTKTSTELHVIVTMLILLHFGIYWLGFSMKMRRGLQWLCLLMQLGLVLLLTQVTQLVILTLALSPILLVAATIMLKRIRAILIFIGSYFMLSLLYMQTIGPVKDWNDFWSGGYAPGVGLLGLFFLVALLLYLQQAHERTLALLNELDAAHAQLSAYALRVEELTMITERQRIARDLHDTLIQGVTGLLMQLDVVHTQLQHQRVERAQELLEQVMESARDAVADARCAIGDLRTERIRPDDLVEVVQEEISRFNATTGISCMSDITLLASAPAPFCEHVLRTITEGLANITHHARARTVWIQATLHDGMLTIEVRDDGVGFDPTATGTQIGHYGLLGMRERAKLIGGQFEIISAPGRETILRLQIPASTTADQEGEGVCLSAFGS